MVSGSCAGPDEESEDSLMGEKFLAGSQRCSRSESAAAWAFQELQGELSSGYSSVTSESSSRSTESLHVVNESEQEDRGRSLPPSRRRPIKRKNGAEHDKDDSNLGLCV